MRILFVMNTPGFLRYFDTTVAELLDRGHEVELAFVRPDMRAEALEVLPDGHGGRLRVLGEAPGRGDRYALVTTAVRTAIDFLRYLHPRYADAEYLRNRRRLRAYMHAPALRVLGERRTLPAPLSRALLRFGLAFEHAVPSSRALERWLRERRADVVCVSPLVTGGSSQADVLKAARAAGVPSVLCVASWDNLTNKGLMRETPDRTVVWNDDQRREAVELHGAAPGSVVATGAQPFDRWFERRPDRDRETFCATVGLDPERPYVLFVGSSSNISRSGMEEAWVRRWVEALRAEPALERVGVVVRPHPDRPGDWGAIDLDGLGDVVVWPPRRPDNSVSPAARADFFDSLFHSAAVVGINTSAMIEAAILRRPVLTVRAAEFEEAQGGTLHFAYLVGDGPVQSARDLQEHVAQLRSALEDPRAGRERLERFLGRFVRPAGLDRPATPLVADAIEGATVTARRPDPLAVVLRPFVAAWALVALARHEVTDPRRLPRRVLRVAAGLRLVAGALRPVRADAPFELAAGRLDAWANGRVRRTKAARARAKAEAGAAKTHGGKLLGDLVEVD